MDPDLVRQQEEAEREALAKLAKTQAGKTASGAQPEAVIAPFAPVFFANPSAPTAPNTGHVIGALTEEAAVRPASQPAIIEEEAAVPYASRPRREPLYVRFGRFISYGFAGAVLGGGLGITAFNIWSLPPDQAQLAIFGSAGALALVCALASLFVTNSDGSHDSGSQ